MNRALASWRELARPSAWLLAAPALLLAACGDAEEKQSGGPVDPYDAPPELEPFELRNVVTEALRALQNEVAPAAGIGPGVEEGPNFPEIAEAEDEATRADPAEVRGLTEMLSSASGDLRSLALADAAALGLAAIPELIAIANDEGMPSAARATALEVLLALDDPRAEITLLELLRTLSDPGLRAHAAWRLSEGKNDSVVPALTLRLKYEHDPETLRWIATALARYDNYAGVEDLLRRVAATPDAAESESFVATADALASSAGLADGASLLAAWQDGDPQDLLPDPTRSAAFELAAWRWIERLSDFQLRGVDDARFVFQRLDKPAAELLASALHDENVYVRTHAAQCLEYMGPRARVAVPDLLLALADPRVGARAAIALGASGAPEAEAALLSTTASGVSPGLRLASVRALAGMGSAASEATEQRLRDLFEDAPSAELWQAAGEGLLARSAGVEVVHALAPCLTGESDYGPLEPRSTDEAIRAWLAEHAAAGNESAAAALERWDGLALEDAYFVPAAEDVRAMRAERRKIAAELRLDP